MDSLSFQKVELADGRKFTVTRSGIGEEAKEFVVNEVSYKGRVFKMYGTYDECMDYVVSLAESCSGVTELTGMAAAVKEIANENFHRELG